MRLVLGLLAALVFAFAGYEMVNLKSQSGNTVAELFDNYVGIFSFGMALLSAALAVPSAMSSERAPTTHAVRDLETAPDLTRSPEGDSRIASLSPVAGWNPSGDRICPSCVRRVADNRTTHCNHCGAQLVTDAS